MSQREYSIMRVIGPKPYMVKSRELGGGPASAEIACATLDEAEAAIMHRVEADTILPRVYNHFGERVEE